jgi:hypothetical protein
MTSEKSLSPCRQWQSLASNHYLYKVFMYHTVHGVPEPEPEPPTVHAQSPIIYTSGLHFGEMN